MRRISSGSPWEEKIGYSRAVIAGVSFSSPATAATDAAGSVVGKGDAYRQTQIILEKMKEVLREAGAALKDVVQTRLSVTDISTWQEVGRAHGEVFGDIRPAMALAHVNPFLDPDMLIEIELIAVLPGLAAL